MLGHRHTDVQCASRSSVQLAQRRLCRVKVADRAAMAIIAYSWAGLTLASAPNVASCSRLARRAALIRLRTTRLASRPQGRQHRTAGGVTAVPTWATAERDATSAEMAAA